MYDDKNFRSTGTTVMHLGTPDVIIPITASFEVVQIVVTAFIGMEFLGSEKLSAGAAFNRITRQ